MTDKTASGGTPVNATRLALERTRVAYERTMMAWVRTGTSLITFGFSVYKFFQIEMKDSIVTQTLLGPRGFGLALIGIGLLSLLLGTFEHARDLKALRLQYDDMPRSTSKVIAVVIAALGLFSLLAVILHA
jgi:putative membrane protein